ncbi:MAG: hypothetical protein LBG50_01410 [Clostridiales Family XIII bacterium]|nr:hypothetical protein [Clostridiales Family XIII bacterium]
MKAIAAAAACAALFLFSATAVFAVVEASAADTGGSGGSLTMTSSPSAGANDLQSQNVGIKLYFNGNVTAKGVQAVNEGCFKFTGKVEGKEVKLPVKAYFGIKRNDYILAIVDTAKQNGNMLANNTAYKLTVSGDLRSDDGRTLGKDIVLDFKTVDQSASTKIYMLLMVGMIGAMIAMTIFDNKRKEKAAAEVAAKGGKVNPYKLAKEKKITVKEAMELIERDRKKRLKRLGIAEGKDETSAAAAAEKPRDTKKVKGPRPIAAAGSTYRTGRSAIVEKRAKEALAKYERSQAAKKPSRGGNANARNRGKKKKRK